MYAYMYFLCVEKDGNESLQIVCNVFSKQIKA